MQKKQFTPTLIPVGTLRKLILVVAILCMSFNIRCFALRGDGLRVSGNSHFLTYEDGSPFYWIGDTGWALFQRLSREEVDRYLDDRKDKGFTIIHAVLYWYPHGGKQELGPLNENNFYGHPPFNGQRDLPKTSRPKILKGGASEHPNDYWDHVEYVIDAAQRRRLKLLILPCWGNAFINARMANSKVVFTEKQARQYGDFLGEKFGDYKHIIWCLGGDVDPVNFGDKDQRPVYRAMAEGIGRGSSGNKRLRWNRPHEDWDQSLITFHAVTTPETGKQEGASSSRWFHNDAWLDFNMMETFKWLNSIYPFVSDDYNKVPVRPTILGEGAYEGGAYGEHCGFITPHKVRIQGYQAFFAGAAGYTYGHWAIWPFRDKYCGREWEEALDTEGAWQTSAIMKSFISNIDIFSFHPDPSFIIDDNDRGLNYEQCSMVNNDASKFIVYFPERCSAKLDLTKIRDSDKTICKWFDPRNGDVIAAQQNGKDIFIPPLGWEDAILILENAE